MLKKLVFASALLATFAGAYAQSSQNFGVTGQVTPGACTVTLTGGGIVDTGTVSQGTAKLYPLSNNGASTVLYSFPFKTVPISITCAAATKVALSIVDNKSAQKLAYNVDDAARHGVSDGTAGTVAIGFYSIAFTAATMDGVNVAQFLDAATGSATFSTTGPTAYPVGTLLPGRTISFAKIAGVTVPDALTTLGGTLGFQTFVSKPYIDAATTVVTPTGSGTLTLVYL